MGRNLYHSAEGSHWTKKNHKYIRKEGNRYIYPEDLQKSPKTKTARDILSEKGIYKTAEYAHSTRKGEYSNIPKRHEGVTKVDYYKTPKSEGWNSYRRTGDLAPFVQAKKATKQPVPYNGEKYNEIYFSYKGKNESNSKKTDSNQLKPVSSGDKKRKDMLNNQRSADYKKLSEQHANRQAAKSGKIVNPTYTLRDDQGNKVMRLQSNDKLSAPTVADYKKFSQLTSGAKNRKKMVDNQGSTRNYTVKSGHQLNSTDAKRWGQEQKAITNARLKEKKRQKALNSQGSYKDYEFENGNGQLSQQTAKEMSKWNRNKEGEKAVKRRNAVNKQGSSYDWRRANTVDDAKSWSKEQQESKGYEIRRSEKDNKKELKKASNRLKKLTNKGYFTVQNGKTVFVPADEATTKKVSKGRQLVDKIKSKFSKKK